MVSFRTAALFLQAVNLCHAYASSETLRSRRLSFEKIGGYEPRSKVTDHNAIDLDLELMTNELQIGSPESFTYAEAVYQQGAFSKSVARVTLNDPLNKDIPKGETVVGVDTSGNEVRGTLYEDHYIGNQTLLVQYNTNQIQSNYVNCQVGANPQPIIRGCLASSASILVEDYGAYLYKYSVTSDNINKRTLAGFSTDAEELMRTCPTSTCLFPDYKKFFEFFGRYDYADYIITKAFDGQATELNLGNSDFSVYKKTGQAEIISRGSLMLNIWMYVIREMEDALDDCDNNCEINGCNDGPVNAWDEAVAFYTGSKEAVPGSSGILLYGLADERCTQFKTCGTKGRESSGTSYVNVEIHRRFVDGQRQLRAGQCPLARINKERIVKLMTVPLIQSTLRSAHVINFNEKYEEKNGAEATISALSVLPIVHECSPEDAKIIYDNMKAGQSAFADFVAVKEAFQRNYECMGVTCAEVGGVLAGDFGEDVAYATKAAPCGTFNIELTEEEREIGLAVGLAVGGMIIAACLVCIVACTVKKRNAKEDDLPIEPALPLQEGAEMS